MSLSSIDLGLEEVFADLARRQAFFRAITQDEIASQIRELRKDRGLNQTAFASRADMKQSAVSRVEQAEYGAWNLTTLFRVAEALDARLKVQFERIEDAILEFEEEQAEEEPLGAAAADGLSGSSTKDQKPSSESLDWFSSQKDDWRSKRKSRYDDLQSQGRASS